MDLRPFASACRAAFRGGRRLAAVGLILAATACTHYYTPSETAVWSKDSRLPATTQPVKVTISNVQVVGHEVLIDAWGEQRWLMDLHDWTDSAVALLRLGLEAKNYRVGDPAEKSLKVSVEAAYMGGGTFNPFVEVVVAVSTGDAKLAVFKGRRPQTFLVDEVFNEALEVAIGKVLDSDLVIDYLTRPSGQEVKRIRSSNPNEGGKPAA
ncbi:MAG: hypothetical protein QNJ67_11115 [Kiloniellales bacterium]|nr:hypothetical protein [Kiloniellales bacterium]